jgi:replicative DNA helicase
LPDAEELSLMPPHSTQAEEAVLGSVLKNGLAIADVLTFLTPHPFLRTRHDPVTERTRRAGRRRRLG